MNGPRQFIGEDVIHFTLPRHAGEPVENIRNNRDAKMRLPAFRRPCMPAMKMGLIFHVELQRRQRLAQFCFYDFGNSHETAHLACSDPLCQDCINPLQSP